MSSNTASVHHRFECFLKKCSSTFASTAKRLNHFIKKHGTGKWPKILCVEPNCEAQLSPANIDRHMRLFHSDKAQIGICEYCGKQMLQSNLTRHSKICSKFILEKFECQFSGCPASFDSENNLKVHSRTHESSMKCPIKNCDSFLKPYNLVHHLRTVHDRITEACQHCGEKILSSSLYYHEQSCGSRGVKRFECGFERCKMAFNTLNNRLEHIARMHQSEVVECPNEGCGRSVKPYYLSKHVREVHGELKKMCQFCDKKVKYLKLHERKCLRNIGVKTVKVEKISKIEKKLPCTFEDCKVTFDSEINRSQHVRRMHRLAIRCPYEDCGRVVKPYYLGKHISAVHGQKKKCQFCGKKVKRLEPHEKRCGEKGLIDLERLFSLEFWKVKITFLQITFLFTFAIKWVWHKSEKQSKEKNVLGILYLTAPKLKFYGYDKSVSKHPKIEMKNIWKFSSKFHR